MKSPCLECRIHYTGADKEQHPACRACTARLAFSAAFGPAGIGGAPAGKLPKIEAPYPANGDRPAGEIVYPWDVVEDVCTEYGITTDTLQTAGRRPQVVAARAEIVRRLTVGFEMGRKPIAALIGSPDQTVYNIRRRLGLAEPKKMDPDR